VKRKIPVSFIRPAILVLLVCVLELQEGRKEFGRYEERRPTRCNN
jgi:hypothetical protein